MNPTVKPWRSHSPFHTSSFLFLSFSLSHTQTHTRWAHGASIVRHLYHQQPPVLTLYAKTNRRKIDSHKITEWSSTVWPLLPANFSFSLHLTWDWNHALLSKLYSFMTDWWSIYSCHYGLMDMSLHACVHTIKKYHPTVPLHMGVETKCKPLLRNIKSRSLLRHLSCIVYFRKS